MSNERAERWLRSIGYTPQFEPSWITEGQRPDFFCPGDRPLWVEVKTFNPTTEQQEMDYALEDLRTRCAKERGLTGDLNVVLGGEYDKAMGRWLLGQVRGGRRGQNVIHTFVIPDEVEDFSRTVFFEYQSTSGPVLESTVALIRGKYPWHPGLEPVRWGDRALLSTNGVVEEECELYDLLESDDSLLSASWYTSDLPLHVGSVSMGFTGNNTDARIILAVKAANKQIRNAQRYELAPGLCVIYHDTLDHAGDIAVASALFGELLVPVRGTMDQAVIGLGGAWNAAGKNNGVGAVRYFRTDDSFTTVINPWADRPLDPAMFPDRPWGLRGRQLVRLGQE